jgi:hypothetical protein
MPRNFAAAGASRRMGKIHAGGEVERFRRRTVPQRTNRCSGISNFKFEISEGKGEKVE